MAADERFSSAEVPGQESWLPQLAVLSVILFVLLYLVPLGHQPLVNPDEPRYAEISREMLANGDFIVPRLNGLRYFEKPPLGYWVNAVSLALFGENPFALRLPGALAAGLTALLVYLFGCRIGLGRKVAMAASLVQLSFGEIYFVATFGVLDSLLTLFLTCGMVFAYLSLNRDRTGDVIVSGLCFGAAFLTKGFLAFAVPVLVFVPWALWNCRWRALFGKGALVAIIALLLALPWSIAIHLQEPDFWRYFFWEEHVERYFSSAADHTSPAYALLLQLPLLAAPWIFLLPAALVGLRQKADGVLPAPTRRFFWLWMLLPFLFFSFSSGKLATYILPCFPPFAMLIAVGLQRYLAEGHRRLFQAGTGLVLLFLGIALVLLATGQAGWIVEAVFVRSETEKFWLAIAALAIGIAAGGGAMRSRLGLVRFFAPAFAVVPLWFVAHYVVPLGVQQSKMLDALFSDHDLQPSSENMLVAKASVAGALSWQTRRDDVHLALSKGEMEYGLGYADAAGRYLDLDGLRYMLEKTGDRQPVLLLCRKACEPEVVTILPPSAQRISNRGFELWTVPAR